MRNYKDARKLFDSVAPWRGQTDRPWDSRRHNYKRMRMIDDQSIQFAYHGTNFVTYHPDDTITVRGFNTPLQQGVFGQCLPNDILFDEGNRVGSTVLLAPTGQVKENGWYWRRFPYWIAKDQAKEQGWGNRRANPDVRVLRCDRPVRLGYDEDRGMWWPVDEASLKPFEWAEIDRKAARQVTEEYRLRDFEAYLKAITTLDLGLLGEYEETGEDTLIELIKSGAFPKAMTHFPRGEGWRNSWYYRQQNQDGLPPTWSYFGKLRTMLYKQAGALTERSELIVSLPEYKRIQSLLYRFE